MSCTAAALRFNSRAPSKENKVKLEASCRRAQAAPAERAPDLSDFMNEWFFGTATADERKSYNLNGGDYCRSIDNYVEEDDRDHHQQQKGSSSSAAAADEEDEDFISYEPPRMSTSSKLTQEWLEEAKRMVAMSPGRHESPPKLVGSPRFAAARGSESAIDRRDPLSRSARRYIYMPSIDPL
ncbi:hypothetical protein ACLOJK_012107 [Asimina triloba]